MTNKNMMGQLKKSSTKAIAAILTAASLMSLSAPAFASTVSTEMQISAEDEDTMEAFTDAETAENTEKRPVEDAEGISAEDSIQEAENCEQFVMAEEEAEIQSGNTLQEATDEDIPEVDETSIQQRIANTKPSTVATASKMILSGVSKAIPAVGIAVSSLIESAFNFFGTSPENKEDIYYEDLSNKMNSIMAELKKNETWVQYAGSMTNANNILDALNARMKTDSYSKLELNEVKREYLICIDQMKHTTGNKRVELEKKAKDLSERILRQNQFTEGTIAGNDFWTTMQLLRVYLLGESEYDHAMESRKSVFDKGYDFQCSQNRFKTDASIAAMEYNKEVFAMYLAINTYTIACLENRITFGYSLSQDEIAGMELRIKGMQQDAIDITKVMGNSMARQFEERSIFDKTRKMTAINEYPVLTKDGIAGEKADWTKEEYKAILNRMKSGFAGREGTMTVREYLFNELGLEFDSKAQYVRVSNYSLGKSNMICVPGMSLDDMIWVPVYADMVNLDATTFEVIGMTVGSTGISINGRWQEATSNFYKVGKIEIE